MARLSHPVSRSLEWLHKHQVTCSRSLYRAIEELRKVRRDFTADPSGDEAPGELAALLANDEGHGQDGRAAGETEVARASSPCGQAHGEDGRATGGAEEARASSPCGRDHGQDGRATEEAEVARASSPCRVAEPVILAPTGPNPAAVAEAAEHADRSMTNEASIPAELRPLTTDHGRRTTDETNEAITPGRSACRPMPAASVTALAMLAVLLTAGLAQVSGALFQARGTPPIRPRDQRPGHAKVAAGPQAPGGPAAIGREISRDETGPDGALPPRGDPLARARAIARPPDPAQTLPVRSRRQDGTGRTGLVAGTTGRRRSIVVNWRWSPVHPRSLDRDRDVGTTRDPTDAATRSRRRPRALAKAQRE